jgi:hypothetical protein
MASRLTPRSRSWLQWASGLLLIATGCVQPPAMAAAAPQIPAGEARIWFYQYYETNHAYSPALIPTVFANGIYVGPAPPRTVFYRDVPPGHYDMMVPNSFGFEYGSAHFDLAAGQQAFVKILYWRLPRNHDLVHGAPGFTAVLVSEQVAQAELATLIPDGGQR